MVDQPYPLTCDLPREGHRLHDGGGLAADKVAGSWGHLQGGVAAEGETPGWEQMHGGVWNSFNKIKFYKIAR